MDFSGFKAEEIKLVDLLGDIFLRNKHSLTRRPSVMSEAFFSSRVGLVEVCALCDQLRTALRRTFSSSLLTFIPPRLFQQPFGQLEDVGIVLSK